MIGCSAFSNPPRVALPHGSLFIIKGCFGEPAELRKIDNMAARIVSPLAVQSKRGKRRLLQRTGDSFLVESTADLPALTTVLLLFAPAVRLPASPMLRA